MPPVERHSAEVESNAPEAEALAMTQYNTTFTFTYYFYIQSFINIVLEFNISGLYKLIKAFTQQQHPTAVEANAQEAETLGRHRHTANTQHIRTQPTLDTIE